MTTDIIVEIIKLLVTGAFGGAFGGTLVAWVNWRIEKRRQKLSYQRELITSWRKMLFDALQTFRTSGGQDDSFTEFVEERAEYFSLKPHLRPETLEALREEKYKEAIDIVEMRRGHVAIDPPDHIVSMLTAEIARIEAEWDLV
jgi:hypothetical protein